DAGAVVANGQGQGIAELELDRGPAGVGVARDVVQRFLDDPVGGQLEVGIEPSFGAGASQGNREGAALADVGHELPQRGCDAEVVEGGGAQAVGDLAERSGGFGGQLGAVADPRSQAGVQGRVFTEVV